MNSWGRLVRRIRKSPLRPWRGLSITNKFILAFVALLLLIAQVALTGFLALKAVVRETDAAIVSSVEVQSRVFRMDAALQDARRLERDFFLRWPTIGFSSALDDYVQTHQEQIDEVIDISAKLQEFINRSNVSVALRQSNPDLVSYVEMVGRYATSFKEAVDLVGTLGIDDVGVLAQAEKNSAQLYDTLQVAGDPELIVLYREMQAAEKEFLSNRQRNKMKGVNDVAERLRQGIRLNSSLTPVQRVQALGYLNAYEWIAKEIVKLDEQILNKINNFDAQAAAVSEKLIGLADAEVKRGKTQIARTYQLTTILQGMAVSAAVLLAGGVANVFATALKRLQAEQAKSERLLLNILPAPIAHRLKQEQRTIADNFSEVTVLFADIVGFTELSARVSPTELVELLNQIFTAFDQLADRHGLEKIKTIGDAYMVVGGLPMPMENHAEAIAEMALDMQQEISLFSIKASKQLGMAQIPSYNIRIGINTGPVVAGVIGTKKFIYDLWGDTVNIASRMESQGIAGCIQVTAGTYELLKDKYHFEERGVINVKGRGEMRTYLLKGRF